MGTALQTAANKYVGRWKHRLTLHFRVWPKFKETHDAIAKEKLIPINGIRINETAGRRCGTRRMRASAGRCSR